MSDAIPLPPRADLDQYKKLARELQRASAMASAEVSTNAPPEDAVPDAVRAWALRWMESLARLRGDVLTPDTEMANTRAARDVRGEVAADAEQITRRWRAFEQKRGAAQPSLADAQFFLAREHGFPSWPKFAEHVRALENVQSPIANFEAAAEAVVAGDERALAALLGKDRTLVEARSLREHRSTLLHYCSANGVEDFRQKTPRNIVVMARMLLDAGAEVNAESDAYGGGSTTLMLTATSGHPERAGVQIALMELLLDHGAAIDGRDSTVNACLRNGRGAAAEFLARKGARLDLEGAAGVGDLDAVRGFFAEDGSLRASATEKQRAAGFGWACEFGRTGVVEFLLGHGVEANAPLSADGETGLHWAALEGNGEIVRLLLARGADVDATETRFGGTPLGWALHGYQDGPEPRAERYYDAVATLVRAGAGTASYESERFDARLRDALSGRDGTV